MISTPKCCRWWLWHSNSLPPRGSLSSTQPSITHPARKPAALARSARLMITNVTSTPRALRARLRPQLLERPLPFWITSQIVIE